ncbi:MAG: hypothetical protein H6Q14_1460 [Bacteroidetes bacterium]|nr:hypothetical protein [Bacteroidota bacterium]
MVRDILIKITPRSIKNLRAIMLAYKVYTYDILRYVKYSNSYNRLDNDKKVRGLLTMTYHIIEKGLTMPETRYGFGKEVVLKLCGLCRKYIKEGYDAECLEFVHSVRILNEYLEFHKNNGFDVDVQITKEIEHLVKISGVKGCSQQPQMTREEFNKGGKSVFNEFCMSRVTVRNYIDKEISDDILNDCLSMALKSPSACNRQPSMVYFLKDEGIKKQFLSFQNGNRGFGHLADVIVVFTSDLSIFSSIGERNEAYLNSGMFAMTFIYALHYHGIGSCALNLSVDNEKDKQIRNLLNIPDNEVITMSLSCGYVPDEFMYAQSPRMDIDNFKTIK